MRWRRSRNAEHLARINVVPVGDVIAVLNRLGGDTVIGRDLAENVPFLYLVIRLASAAVPAIIGGRLRNSHWQHGEHQQQDCKNEKR